MNGKRKAEPREIVVLGTASQPEIGYLTCEICGQRMSERHCKIVCPNCGYTRDCCDP